MVFKVNGTSSNLSSTHIPLLQQYNAYKNESFHSGVQCDT